MANAADLTPEKRFFGLFVGPSGCGKTVAAASFPASGEGFPNKGIEVLDFDGRIRGLLGAPWIDRSKVNYTPFLPKDPMVVDKLNQKFEVWMASANNPTINSNLPYTLIIDSITNATFAFITKAITLTHKKSGSKDDKERGKFIGGLAMPGPEDYGFESQATQDTLAFLQSLPIPNVIVTAHVIDRYGKEDPDDPFSASVVVGEKLSLRDKLAANVPTKFDHIFRFDRQEINGKILHYVKFRSDFARTTYAALPNGSIDITGKNFYELMQGYLALPKLAGDQKSNEDQQQTKK